MPLGLARCGRDGSWAQQCKNCVNKPYLNRTLDVAQSLPSRQTDPRLTREPSLNGAIGRTNGFDSFGAQPPQGIETVGAGPNVRTRVRSPHPLKESRKRRAISIKGGRCRTGSRTPVGFTVLDATIISAPTNNNTNHNGRFDFMTQNAERGAATAASAEHRSCTTVLTRYHLHILRWHTG
jgi:hypothetical protein